MKAILSWLAGCSDCSYSPREEVSLALLFPKHLSGLRTENNDHSTVFTYVINLHLRINSTMPILHFIFFKNIRKIKNKKKNLFWATYSLSKFSEVNSSTTTHFGRQTKKVHLIFLVYAPKHEQYVTEKNHEERRFRVLICLITLSFLCLYWQCYAILFYISLSHTQNTCLLSVQCT